MIAIRGFGSEIVKALIPLLPKDEIPLRVRRFENIPLDCGRYLFCAGLLHGRSTYDHNDASLCASFGVNLFTTVKDCEEILNLNERARICVIGSESGISGSYDGAYAMAKAALHHYIETRRLQAPAQQLVCIAPSIISDAGMTLRRKDTIALRAREFTHPKGRFLKAAEVASLIHHVLYVDQGYLSNVTIRMNGGEHTVRRV